jgi:deoxyribose-phosphate aldolase
MSFTYEQMAKMIDHSLLNPTLTVADLEAGCRLAVAYNVASVCIMPYYLSRCTEMLHGSTVKPSTTIGFPHGGNTTAVKLAEAKRALTDGCEELDMVVNISQVLSGNWDYVREDIRSVVDVAHASGQKVKVIFENCYLKDEHKIRLCEICGELKADWVKTSTGYGTGGATHDDLKLMRKHSPEFVQVKAAGGVRDLCATWGSLDAEPVEQPT